MDIGMTEAFELLIEKGKRSPGDAVTFEQDMDRLGYEGWRDMTADELMAALRKEYEALRDDLIARGVITPEEADQL